MTQTDRQTDTEQQLVKRVKNQYTDTRHAAQIIISRGLSIRIIILYSSSDVAFLRSQRTPNRDKHADILCDVLNSIGYVMSVYFRHATIGLDFAVVADP